MCRPSVGHPYVVLDQNVVSDASVVRTLQAEYRRTGQRIVLSSASRYEMTKGGLDGFLTDIAELSNCPEATCIALPVLHLGRLEAQRRRTVVDIYDHGSTRNFRTLLNSIRAGALSGERLSAGFGKERDEAARQMHVIDWEAFYLKTAAVLANPKTSSEAEKKRVLDGLNAKPPRRQALRESMFETFGNRVKLKELIEGVDAVRHIGGRLGSFPSMIALDIMANITVAYYWSIKGVDTRARRNTKMVNEAVDVEGAVLACRGKRFETRDARALGLFQDLRFYAKRIWGSM